MLRSPQKYNLIDGFYVLEQRVPLHYTRYIYTVLEIDGYPVIEYPKYSIDVAQLSYSLQGSGFYTILQPGLGFSSERDIVPQDIEVTHHAEHITWKVGSSSLERLYHFEKKAYTSLVEKMKDDLLAIVEQQHQELKEGDTKLVAWGYDRWAFLQPLLQKYGIC